MGSPIPVGARGHTLGHVLRADGKEILGVRRGYRDERGLTDSKPLAESQKPAVEDDLTRVAGRGRFVDGR